MLNDFFLITRMGVVFSGLLAKEGKCQATPMARRTLFFSMMFALSACSGGSDGSDDSTAVAISKGDGRPAVVIPIPKGDSTAVDIPIPKDGSPAVVIPKGGSGQAKEQEPDFTKTQPTLSAIAGDSRVKLNWDAIPNSASYTLCHATGSLGNPADLSNCAAYTNGTLVLNITNTIHTETGLLDGTTYYFVLVAVDGNGKQSLPSAQASATPVIPIVDSKLNDTGITWGARYPNGNNAGCTGTAIAQQDCSHGRDAAQNDGSDGHAGFSFTKLGSTGTALAASASVWNCVQDNVTGLIWEVKTTDKGLHDAGHQYSWYNTDSSTNGGAVGHASKYVNTCQGYASGQPATYCNTQAFTARVNKAGLCGARDWHLPTRTELRGIVNYTKANPAIDTGYFPETLSAQYWSSLPYANSSDKAWVVRFDNGREQGTIHSSGNRRIRLVSSGQ